MFAKKAHETRGTAAVSVQTVAYVNFPHSGLCPGGYGLGIYADLRHDAYQ